MGVAKHYGYGLRTRLNWKYPPPAPVKIIRVGVGVVSPTDNSWNNYSEYLQTLHWKKIRETYFNDPDTLKKCYVCDYGGNLQLHHKNYERLGRELLTDLLPLCKHCHKNVHIYLDKNGGSLKSAAKRYKRSIS